MFTEENTGIADCARHVMLGGTMVVRLYSLSKGDNLGAMHLDSDSNNWMFSQYTSEEIESSENTILLSRPQSDIDALFNDAPGDWVTGYASYDGAKFWVSDSAYNHIDNKKLKQGSL